jgi:hypothetical protein
MVPHIAIPRSESQIGGLRDSPSCAFVIEGPRAAESRGGSQ